MHTDDPIDAALSNDIILDGIFHYHSAPETLRLVCKIWNNVALSGCPRQTLNLITLSRGKTRQEFKTCVDSMDSRLAKSIELELENTEMESKQELQVPMKLLYICEKLGPIMQKLFITWSFGIVPALVEIFRSGYCKNIKCLVIDIDPSESAQPVFIPPSLTSQDKAWPKLAKLSTIRFVCYPTNYRKCNWTPDLISKLLTQLLDAAPNLEELSLDSFSCPSLECNKDLKSFKFTFSSIRRTEEEEEEEDGARNINSKNLSQILKNVADSLETLQLNFKEGDNFADLKIPVMSKLKYLSGDAMKFFRLMKQIRKERLPSLTRFKIPGSRIILDAFLPDFQPNITWLGLTEVDETAAAELSGLKRVFPSLQKLDLSLKPLHTDDEDYGFWVGIVLESCSKLGLVHLKLKTRFSYRLSRVVDRLWECRVSLLEGLETLQIINQNKLTNLVGDDLTRDGRRKLKDILIEMKEMENVTFQGLVMQVGHVREILEFISDNQLPVAFID